MRVTRRGMCAAILSATLIVVSSCGKSSTTENGRPYFLGFTPFPYDIGAGPLAYSYDQITKNADLIAHHFDNGIPWNEALTDSYPYSENIMSDWQMRKDSAPAGHKVYVAVTPIDSPRSGLALYRKNSDNLPLVSPFESHGLNKAFQHSDVKTAYLNYCKRVIEYFRPDFFAFGIEVNLLRKHAGATVWSNFKEFNQFIYSSLKALYPTLPIFTSVAGVSLLLGYETPPAEFSSDPNPAAAFQNSQLAALQDVLEGSDYYALSLYPYLSSFFYTLFPDSYPATMFSDLFSLSSKPIAIAETGYPGSDIKLGEVTLVGSPTAQKAYWTQLLAQADQRRFKFLVNFMLRDYTQFCANAGCPAASLLWETTGLIAADGSARPSLQLFKDALTVPVSR